MPCILPMPNKLCSMLLLLLIYVTKQINNLLGREPPAWYYSTSYLFIILQVGLIPSFGLSPCREELMAATLISR
jgi:hypothetical protein